MERAVCACVRASETALTAADLCQQTGLSFSQVIRSTAHVRRIEGSNSVIYFARPASPPPEPPERSAKLAHADADGHRGRKQVPERERRTVL